MGTGPYVFEEWRAGGRIAMTSNPDYFDGPVNIPRVVFTFATDENARAAMLENGSIDAAGLVPKLAPRFRDNADYRVLEVPSADARVMSLPNENPVLDDPAVRRALSLAIDREAMVEGVLAGAGEPAYGPVMPGHWAYDPAAEVPHDPAEARNQLEEAGWQDTDGDEVLDKDGEPLSFTLMYPADDDPFTNTPLMRNPTIDAALDEARSTLDRDQRVESYRELQQAYAEDSSWLFLVRLKHIVVTSKRVTGVEPQVAEPHAHGFSRGTSWNMENWTLDG